MNAYDWAENEVRIAYEQIEGTATAEEKEYYKECFGKSLGLFKTMTEGKHGSASLSLVQKLLNQMIDYKPLSPLQDDPTEWKETFQAMGISSCSYYLNTRLTSLIKQVYSNGKVKYHDRNRWELINAHNDTMTIISGLSLDFLDDMFPITMPYMPEQPIKVYCEHYADPTQKNSITDIVAFLHLKHQNGSMKCIDKYFERVQDNGTFWFEINKTEYNCTKEEFGYI